MTALNVTPAQAATQIIIGHRGMSTSNIPENTKLSFTTAAPDADELETGIRWTRDPSGSPDRTIVLHHDATLDRMTNCSGRVKDWYYADIALKCRTDVNGPAQPVMKLSELLPLAKTYGKRLVLEIKVGDITDHQARQFWNQVKTYSPATASPRIQVHAFNGTTMNSVKKIKALDLADANYNLRYGYIALGSNPPSAASVLAIGPNLHIGMEVPTTSVAAYKAKGIRVFLWVGRTEADYALMVSKAPNGVVVDDPKRFKTWYVNNV